jgi:hypothetical protein
MILEVLAKIPLTLQSANQGKPCDCQIGQREQQTEEHDNQHEWRFQGDGRTPIAK